MKNPIDLDTLVLKSGAHRPNTDGDMCAMEAVAFIAGEDWSASPDCVSPVITAFCVALNDGLDNETRQQLKPYLPRVIGTRDNNDEQRAWIATDWLVRVCTPRWLRAAGLNEQAAILEQMPELDAATCPSILPALQAVRKDADAAWAAAWDAARDAAWDAAWDAARAAAWDAAWDAAWAAARAAAWDAAWAAARDAARAAAWDAAWDAARDAARDAAASGGITPDMTYDQIYKVVYDAALPVLKPIADDLNQGAFELLDRLITVGVPA